MRKYHLLSLSLFAFIFLAISCTKEGPQGIQGPVGATGSQGPVGPTGTANVIYSSWAPQASWADTTITLPNLGLVSRSIRTAPGITSTILTSGVVLTYWQPATTNIYLLPTLASGGSVLNCLFDTGKVIFYVNASGGSAGGNFRYVIIPGGVAGGRLGYTTEQLQAMPYDQVAELFNIPASGSNIGE